MENLYDIVIAGGGPAGLTAALYLARAQYRVIVIEREQYGGQIAITEDVVNYPGIEHIGGKELAETMRSQAEAFGAEFRIAEVTGFDTRENIKTVHTDNGDIRCIGMLIATGATPRIVGFKGEEQYKGRGVAYCATCDGEFFTGKEIFVVGGGYAAAEESVFLTKFASHVTVLVREEDFTCAPSVADKAKNNDKITVLYNTEMEEISGDNGLNYARYKNTKTNKITEYRAKDGEIFGVFVFAGYEPATDFLKGTLQLNEQGYIVTDNSCKTNIDGIYAAGDVCIKPLRQLVTATSDGALAATELEKYAEKVRQHLKTDFSEKERQNTSANDNSADENAAEDKSGYFTQESVAQLNDVFGKMERKLLLKLTLDSRPISDELKKYTAALVGLTDKLNLVIAKDNAESDTAPCVEICTEDGSPTGLAFHGVPSGHEFTSFVLGLYNAAGPGQTLDAGTISRINSITSPLEIKVLVTLSCTMCPDLVIAAQHIAAINPRVTADIYDVLHFESLRQQYNVMSVPCLVINGSNVSFGRKNISRLLDYIEKI